MVALAHTIYRIIISSSIESGETFVRRCSLHARTVLEQAQTVLQLHHALCWGKHGLTVLRQRGPVRSPTVARQMVKALMREQGSPRGNERYGFATIPARPIFSKSERDRAAEHIVCTREGLGMVMERTRGSETSRDRWNALQQEGRARLGMVSGRDSMPQKERAQLQATTVEGHNRLGWLEERNAASQASRECIGEQQRGERSRLHGNIQSPRDLLGKLELAVLRNNHDISRAKMGFVSQFGGERGVTSEADLIALNKCEREQRARLGMMSARTSTDWSNNRREAGLRAEAMRQGEVERLRLYADETRTAMPQPERSEICGRTREGRERLGMLDIRTSLSQPELSDISANALEGRSRLGFIDGRTHLHEATRLSNIEKGREQYQRLGFITHSGPRRLQTATATSSRTQLTEDVINKVREEQEHGRSRAGFLEERTISTVEGRSATNNVRRDDRHRFGMVSSRNTTTFVDRSRPLTARSRQESSMSMHFGPLSAQEARMGTLLINGAKPYHRKAARSRQQSRVRV